MTSYDSSARRSLTTWVVANHGNVRVAHFLVGSKLVAMGVSAASLAAALVGLNMRAHTDRATFESELARLKCIIPWARDRLDACTASARIPHARAT